MEICQRYSIFLTIRKFIKNEHSWSWFKRRLCNWIFKVDIRGENLIIDSTLKLVKVNLYASLLLVKIF